jgi:non-ribosomal peptide synthetase component F
VLEQVAADPGVRLGAVEILAAGEREQVTAGWNDTAAAVPSRTIPEEFDRQVAWDPDAIAVVAGQTIWTYTELDTAANKIAWFLIGAGIGPEQVVGVVLGRSPELVAVLLGVLKAGAAYLPVDPEYPAERIGLMLADASPAIVICANAASQPRDYRGIRRVVLGDPDVVATIAAYPGTPPTDADRLTAVSGTPGVCHLHFWIHRGAEGCARQPPQRHIPHRWRGTALRFRSG